MDNIKIKSIYKCNNKTQLKTVESNWEETIEINLGDEVYCTEASISNSKSVNGIYVYTAQNIPGFINKEDFIKIIIRFIFSKM